MTSPRYPPIEPYDSGMLDVGDGHRLYWETSGNPHGTPALFVHGGPGAPVSGGARGNFDPDAYRIVLFHQRGCGRSTPNAAEPDADLTTNTTPHLIADIERLRAYLGIDTWVVLGVSWGTTLGLAYAQAHPDRVRALVLGLVTLTDRREVEWMTRHIGRIYPEAWDRFTSAVPESLRDRPLVDAYATMMFDPDPAVQARAALGWSIWDNAQMGRPEMPARFGDPDFRLCYGRIVTHYWRNGSFLPEGQLLDNAASLNHIPGVLIHGRNDYSCPFDTPWHLAQRWTSSAIVVVDSGHGNATTFSAAVVAALNKFRGS